MIRLTYNTMSAIAQALLAQRASAAKYLAHWRKCRHDPHAAELATACLAELEALDAALLEVQAAAPPVLRNFLNHQIDLIQQPARAAQPSIQEAL